MLSRPIGSVCWIGINGGCDAPSVACLPLCLYRAVFNLMSLLEQLRAPIRLIPEEYAYLS